jgi:hypothetical protein
MTNYQPTEGVKMLRELADELEKESKEIQAAIAELFRVMPRPKKESTAFSAAVLQIERLFGVPFTEAKP